MESFFYNGSSLDLIEIEELLLSRYHNMEYIMDLDVNEGVLLINKAIEKRQEGKHFTMWSAQLPFMTEKNYISFEEYRDRLTGRNIDTTPTEEVLAKAKEIQEKARQKRGE